MRRILLILIPVLFALSTVAGYAQIVTTLAGSGLMGSNDGIGAAASFNLPSSIVADGSGNLYVAEYNNHKIRKISPAGEVTTFAGSGMAGSADGIATAAQFNHPYGITIDANGNLYVTDAGNHKIRKINPAGEVTTFAGSGTAGSADGIATVARFNSPYGIAIDGNGNLYVSDYGNHTIRKVNPAGEVITFAGSGIAGDADGVGVEAKFNSPTDVAVDSDGNIYVSDFLNDKIRKISAVGEVSTFAGSGAKGSTDGMGAAASFEWPIGVGIDGNGNIYVADLGNLKIRKISAAGEVTTFAGNGIMSSVDGIGTAAGFSNPVAIAADVNGNLYVAESYKIRKITENALPVTLVSFTAKAFGNYAQLQWQTASEVNNKGFEIWRKAESLKLKVESGDNDGFVKIGEVSAHVTHNTQPVIQYTLTDKKPLNGTNYYKLVQVDNDGKATELGIRTVNFGLPTSDIRLFPNPFQTHLTIVSSVPQSAEVTNISGQSVGHFKLKVGENTINTSAWPIGIYILKTSGESIKLVKK